MNRHYGPWPGPTLKKVLDEGTLFSEVVNSGGKAALANVYPRGYFWALEHGKQKAQRTCVRGESGGCASANRNGLRGC